MRNLTGQGGRAESTDNSHAQHPVTKKTPAHLKLVPPESPAYSPPSPGASEANLSQAFQELTGWELRHVTGQRADLHAAWSAPVLRHDAAAGRLELNRTNNRAPQVELEQASRFVQSLTSLFAEQHTLRQALVAREAELSASVPVRIEPNESHLSQRLEAILKGGARAVGCTAAALYLLDDATTTLKLRSSFGLPTSRLCDPPRQLRGAVADLEALIGHAVVLEDTRLLPHWMPPESFPAAVCVPVSSPTIPLGTLWFFADASRDFTDEQTNLLEIIAGRVSAELERETLLTAGVNVASNQRERATVSEWQRGRLPSIAPLIDGWELGGFTLPAGAVGREFFDWQVLPDGQLCVALGAGSGSGVNAALNGAAVHAAYKAHTQYPQTPNKLLRRLNETLWSAGQGDQFGALAFAAIAPTVGRGSLATTGGPAAVVIGKDRVELLTSPRYWLGQEPEQTFVDDPLRLAPGDVLLLVSGGLVEEGDAGAFDPDSLAEFVRRYRRHSLEGMLTALQKLVHRAAENTDRDATLVAIRRLGR